MRTFLSIELPDKIKKNIENLTEEFKLNLTPIKWVHSKLLHITLKFLGEVNDNLINELSSVISACIKDKGKFKINISGIGAFPSKKKPKVIWVGIKEGSETVEKLADCLEDELAKKGFREEERDFTAHITVGRIKENVDIATLEKHIDQKENVDLGSFEAEHVSIMKSTLTPKGPVYEEIRKVKFKE